MKILFKPVIALILFSGIVYNPVVAQPVNETTNSRDNDGHDNNKWGLLGLIGLVGLVNLKKNQKSGTYSTTNSPQGR